MRKSVLFLGMFLLTCHSGMAGKRTLKQSIGEAKVSHASPSSKRQNLEVENQKEVSSTTASTRPCYRLFKRWGLKEFARNLSTIVTYERIEQALQEIAQMKHGRGPSSQGQEKLYITSMAKFLWDFYQPITVELVDVELRKVAEERWERFDQQALEIFRTKKLSLLRECFQPITPCLVYDHLICLKQREQSFLPGEDFSKAIDLLTDQEQRSVFFAPDKVEKPFVLKKERRNYFANFQRETWTRIQIAEAISRIQQVSVQQVQKGLLMRAMLRKYFNKIQTDDMEAYVLKPLQEGKQYPKEKRENFFHHEMPSFQSRLGTNSAASALPSVFTQDPLPVFSDVVPPHVFRPEPHFALPALTLPNGTFIPLPPSYQLMAPLSHSQGAAFAGSTNAQPTTSGASSNPHAQSLFPLNVSLLALAERLAHVFTGDYRPSNP